MSPLWNTEFTKHRVKKAGFLWGTRSKRGALKNTGNANTGGHYTDNSTTMTKDLRTVPTVRDCLQFITESS